MRNKRNASNNYASFTNIVSWWFIFVLLDAIIWGVLMNLHVAYIGTPPSRGGGWSLNKVLALPLLGFMGKMLLLQYPCMLVLACVYRKKWLFYKRYWALLPTVSYLIGFCVYLIPQIISDVLFQSNDSFLYVFTNVRDSSDVMLLMALVSTVITTVLWTVYLKLTEKPQQSRTVV